MQQEDSPVPLSHPSGQAAPARALAWLPSGDAVFRGTRWLRRVQGLPLLIAESLAAERLQLSLWAAPAVGLGAAAYFALPQEPPLWVGPLALLLLGGGAVFLWRRGANAALPLLFLAAMALGLTAADLRAYRVAAPVVSAPFGPAEITATVLAVEPEEGRVRLLLGSPVFAEAPDGGTPERLRVTVPTSDIAAISRSGESGPPIGSVVRLNARLLPPPAPSAPGPFDFQRDAWFQRLGGVGFAYGPVRLVEAPAESGFALWLQTIRMTVATRLEQGVGGPEGAVAAALATGLRAEVPVDVINAYRDAGLSHLLAIAGLHLGLAAGIIFVTVRAALALIPWLALRVDIKKIAAAVALLATFAYLLLSGARIPTERAFITGGIALLAILLDRSPVSLRALGVAAVAILLLQPEAIIGPSFQMSFAAVTALIVSWEALSPRLSRWRRGSGGPVSAGLRTAAVYLLATLASTTVAGLATAPFTAYHFHRVALYGSVGNLIAIPLASLWIMPWLVIALILMPFGGDAVADMPLRWGLKLVEMAARDVSSWPGAALHVPPVPIVVLVVISLAGLWLALWRQRWRHLAWPVIVICAALPWRLPQPDVIVSEDGGLIAVRSGPGVVLSPGRNAAFVRDEWQQVWGIGSGTWQGTGGKNAYAPPDKTLSVFEAALHSVQAARQALAGAPVPVALTCDSLSCRYRAASGALIAIVRHPAGLADACAAATVVVNLTEANPAECAARSLFTRQSLRNSGALMITLAPDGSATIATVAEARGYRPWVLADANR